jgi:hypothetical protein
MGFGVSLLVGAIASVVIAATMKKKQPNADKMQPQGLDSFQMNQNSEGQAVPWVRGKVRLTTNLLWYGNLESQAVYQKTGGKGMGMGGGKKIAGYDYFLDMWHSVCQGPNVTLNKVYIQDRERDIADLPVNSYTFNPGDANDFPTEPGIYAAPLNPVAHIFLDRYALGTNATTAPTLHFVVTVTSGAPLTYVTETNGCNPAAVVYDLLRDAGVPMASINTASFEDASTYWHNKGYGINIALNSQAMLKDHINKIQSYVDFALRIDENDQFVIKAYKETDASTESITTQEFKEFQFSRRSWDDVFSDFRGNFIDELADYSTRTIRIRNPAARELIGHDKQKSIDLTAFRDRDTASDRMWEMMKKLSYPEAQIRCTVGPKWSGYNVGDVIGITNADYDITDQDYRITGKDEAEYGGNGVKFELVQVLEPLMNDLGDTAQDGGGTSWVAEHDPPAAATHERVLELPYTAQFGDAPAYLILASRAGNEDGFTIFHSPESGGDFDAYSSGSYFSQYGTVSTAAYPDTTLAIDDTVGLRFTPDRVDPTFDTISRPALFSTSRIGVLYDPSTDAFEIFAFQTVTPVAQTSDYTLTGVIRGLMNTQKQSWAVGKEVWLTNIGDNVLTGISEGQFYLKIAPFLLDEQFDEGSASEITVNYRGRAKTPWPPALVKVVRSGATLTVTVWPTTRVYAGAGVTDGAGTSHGSTEGQTDQWPPEFVGSFNYSDDGWTTTYNDTSYTWNYTNAGAHTLRVKALVSGYTSGEAAVVVGASDGDYYGPAA